MANGIDLSEHNGVWPSEQFALFDFVILRGFNEWGTRDHAVDVNAQNARGQTLVGYYGWPVPGRDNFLLGRQLVEAFPDAVAGYWADRERSGAGLASEAEVEDYLRGIESMGGKAGFYSNIGETPHTPYLDVHDHWMADYGPNNGARHDPYAQPPVPQRPYTIHQYSSAGGLDRNYSETLDWTGAPPPPITPAPEDTMRLFHDTATDLWWLATSTEMILCPPGHVWNLAAAGVPQGVLPTDTVEWLGQQLPAPPSGGVIDYAALAKAVNDDAAKRMEA